MGRLKKQDVSQFARYVVVGLMNTWVTLMVIYVCKSLLGFNPWFSNALGYVLGMINSFLWNKKWVFKSLSANYRGEAVKFLVGFLLCYGLQFMATWLFTKWLGSMEIGLYIITVSAYGVATMIGMVVYTMANFIYNRLVTFR